VARNTENPNRGEVLVAIMRSKRDWRIAQEQLWYRVPVDKAPKRWPPRWLAFYLTKTFGVEGLSVQYYGRVESICELSRSQLFPQEPAGARSNRRYYKVGLQSLLRLPQPILSRRFRRIVFIPTTWTKFSNAVEINDLFDESPLEDRLWAELKRLRINAIRQMDIQAGGENYRLDFALYCREGKVDVETDGDSWHARPERIPLDNRRDNALTGLGWHVLRFNGHQVREEMAEYCLPQITETVGWLGGIRDKGAVPSLYTSTDEGIAHQPSLFDSGDKGGCE